MTDPVYDAVAQASSAAVIRGYSSSFALACRMLGPSVRTHVRNIYALVRLADEIVDGPPATANPERSRARLDALESELSQAVASGYSTNVVVHACALTIRRFDVDPGLFTAFFESMRMDLTMTEHTPETLRRYIYGSAEVVGLMCLQVFLAAAGRTDYADLAPGARSLGSAFQKINFLRDLAADHEDLGRAYFPGIDLTRFSDADKDALVADVRADLAVAEASIAALPANSRAAVAAAAALFAELTRRVAATPAHDLMRRRVRVAGPAKVRVLARAFVTAALGSWPTRGIAMSLRPERP